MFSALGLAATLAAIGKLLLSWLERRSDQHIGAVAQTAVAAQSAATTQIAIAKAEVAAPQTKTALIAALTAGDF